MSNYKKMDEQDLKIISTFLDRERILWHDEINEEYSHDELTVERSYPDLVARVVSAQEVSKILAYANEKKNRRDTARRGNRTCWGFCCRRKGNYD